MLYGAVEFRATNDAEFYDTSSIKDGFYNNGNLPSSNVRYLKLKTKVKYGRKQENTYLPSAYWKFFKERFSEEW